MPVTQTQEKTKQVVNAHVQHVVNTVKVENSEIIKQTALKPILVAGNTTSAPAVTCAHADFVVKCVTPVSTVACVTPVTTLIAAHRQVPLIQGIQQMVEVPQIQFIDKVVDALVSMQRQVQVQEQSDETLCASIASADEIAPGSDGQASRRHPAGDEGREE